MLCSSLGFGALERREVKGLLQGHIARKWVSHLTPWFRTL